MSAPTPETRPWPCPTCGAKAGAPCASYRASFCAVQMPCRRVHKERRKTAKPTAPCHATMQLGDHVLRCGRRGTHKAHCAHLDGCFAHWRDGSAEDDTNTETLIGLL